MKSTIHSYVRGSSLIPIEIGGRAARLGRKPVGWLYYGNMECYVRNRFLKISDGELLGMEPSMVDIVVSNVIESVKAGDYQYCNRLGYPQIDYIDWVY